jgi:4-hydroxy-2-oxoheptanedioate aldolase
MRTVVRSVAATLVVAGAVWTGWTAAAAQGASAGGKRLRISPIIQRLEEGGLVGPDVWTMIDMEHGAFDVKELRARFEELAKRRKPNGQLEVTPGVRIPAYGYEDPSWMVKQVLDVGALAIVFPQIENKEQALRAIRAMRLPPQRGGKYPNPPGLRGAGMWSTDMFKGFPLWGPMTPDQYIEVADVWPLNPNGELFAYLQIESPAAVKNINQILEVPGVGGILIGANDLSFNLGVGRATRTGAPLAPETQEAALTVLRACNAKKVHCAMIGGGSREEIVKMGFFGMPK